MSDLRDQWAAAVLGDRSVPVGVLRTAWALREYANTHGVTLVSNKTIARVTGQVHRVVKQHITVLVARGYLERFDRGHVGYGRSFTARTQFVVPGLLGDALLDIKRGISEIPPLDIKRGIPQCQKGDLTAPKGGSGRSPRTNMTNITTADARARPKGSRAALEKDVRRADPLACAISLLSAAGLPYPDEAIMRNCGVTLEQLEHLKRMRA